MKIVKYILLAFVFAGIVGTTIVTPTVAMADDIDKILKAKEIVRGMVNYPDTLVFHEFDTKVRGNKVTLKFTCKNGFGVPETHVMDIDVK